MPSSPNFVDYQRQPERFFYRGVQLVPQDALSEGKLAWALNIRSYEEGTITVREGLSAVSDGSLGNPVHTLFRLNDDTPYAAVNAKRFAGAGTVLYAGNVGASQAYVSAVTGFSGNPLTGIVSTPFSSPRPYLYIGDSAQLRKINSDLDDYPVGIASPLDEPDATYAAVQTTYLNTVGGASPTLWSSYGVATPASPTPLPITDRINTTVTQILFDLGSNPSMASVALDDMTAVIPGIDVVLGASNEEVIVEEVHPAIAPTTIASIIYDVGSTGLCTIQPTGSFTQGQVEAAAPADVEARFQAGLDVPPRVSVTRTVDYAVDSLVELNASEVVRILSIAIGPDGTMSFRCSTAGTFTAGNSITGIACFRAFVNTAVAVASAAVADCITNTITPAAADVAEVGGIQSPMSGGSRNWGLVGNRASQPEDYIRFGIKVSSLSYVQSVRLLLNVSDDNGSGGSDFLHNYYFYEWRQNDLLAAIQVVAGQATSLVATEQAGAVQQGQVDAYYQDQYGYNTTVEGGAVQRGPRGIMPAPTAPPKGPKGTMTAAQREQQAKARAQQADGTVTVGSAISRQLAVGNEQWIVLQCRLGDLTRVGTEQSLTLNAILGAAITVQAYGTTDPITISYSDCYLTGGYGPDVSMTWNPYVYRYRYRSTITGARSNPSPPMRAGVKPHRGRIVLTPRVSSDPQVDVIDWYRLGGALARWAYIATSDNGGSPSQFTDDYADTQIESGETLSFDHYQPWPVTDLPRTGTCNVAGNAIEWVSGDTFNTAWAEGSLIVINGRATALYKQPDSTTLLFVKDSCGDGSAVDFSLPGPTILSQPLEATWGGPIENTLFHFACGDPSDPGVLHWSFGNDPDSTSDRNTLYVTDASDPLVNGCFYDGIPYVFSSTRLFRIVLTGDVQSPFRAIETACTRGLWAPWAFCVWPGGIAFLSGDGVYTTDGGAEAKCLTDPDLRPLFPQDGSTPQPVRNLYPIDFTATGSLKLTYVDQYIYFDYLDLSDSPAGALRTLVFDPRADGWTPDQYDLSGVTARLSETSVAGPEVHSALVGCDDGLIYAMDASKTTDVLTDIQWAVWTRWPNAGDPRSYKQWGDAILDMNPAGSADGIEVTPVINYGNTALTPRVLGALDTERFPYIVEIGDDSPTLGNGVWSRNLGLWIQGAVQACDVQRPILYLWEPSFAQKQITVAKRATDWSDLGYMGAKFVQGVVIRANTFGVPKTVYVQHDEPNDSPISVITLTINHNGEETKAYPLAAGGWDPFIAQLVRLQGADDVEWALLEWRFVWEPAPEAATQWETQFTTHDLPGFLAAYDGVIAYAALAPVTLTVEYENGQTGSYTLTSTSGNYYRQRLIFEAQKGKAIRYRWTSNAPFRLFKADCSVRIQGWGLPGGYQIVSPFGGPSRVDGAGI